MQTSKTAYRHVILDQEGNPVIAGTTMKVIELVGEKLAYGWSPEEIHFQHPYLSLGQIYSALAYYADHQKELDAEIARRLEKVDEVRKNLSPGRLSGKLSRRRETF